MGKEMEVRLGTSELGEVEWRSGTGHQELMDICGALGYVE